MNKDKPGDPHPDGMAEDRVMGGRYIAMRDRRGTWAAKSCGALALLLALIGLMVAQAQQPAKKARGQIRDQGGAPVPKEKAKPNAADPLGKAGPAGPLLPGTYHFTFKLHAIDGAPLAASYYRSKLESNAPVVMLIHESGRSRKDFEDPVLELKGQGLAEHLQGLDYAVLSLDLRGQGQNPRHALTRGERPRLIEDIQAAYFFLVDRHNRGELNLSKLGVIALGDGANLAAAWAYHPGAAVTIEGHPSDLSALALISPMPEGSGYQLRHITPSLATRIPMLLLAAERDAGSKDAVQGVRPLVERGRLNKIELYPSSLHGYKLLRLEPKVTSTLFHFLDNTIKNRAVAWEPQYNLLPVTFSEIQTVRHTKPDDPLRKAAADRKDAGEARPPAGDAKAPPAENEKPKRKRPQPSDER
jgi:pimeloyl-ACP methyl ester carboxylesterase